MALIDNLLAYWNLNDDGSGNVSLVDSTGNGNSLNNNGCVLGAGKIGGDAQFDGNSSDLNVSLATNPSFSYGFWVYLNSYGQHPISDFGESIFDNRSGDTTDGVFLNITTDGYLRVCSRIVLYTGTATVPTGSWQYINFVVNSGTIYLYINGSLCDSLSDNGTSWDSGTLLFGKNEDGLVPFDGSIDEVGVWNRALSQAEVIQLYNGGAGLTYPFGALYYTNAASDGDWGNLANWWKDSGFTIPATALPDATIAVYIYGNITQNTAASNICTCAAAEFHNSTFGSAVTLNCTGLVNIFGTSIFQGTCTDSASIHDSSYFDTTAVIEGNATLRDSSYNLGTIQGNAYVYYDGGNGTLPIGGLVDGTVTYIGWPAKSPQYFNDTVSGGGNDQSWTNLANWWADSSFTTRPLNATGTQALPDAGTVCYIATNAYSNTSGITVQSVEILSGGSMGYGSITTNQLTLDVGSSIGIMTIYSPMTINASEVYQCTVYGNTEFKSACNMQGSSLFGGTMTIDAGAYIDGGEDQQNTIGVPIQVASSGSGGGGGFISRLLNLPWFIKF
jgi:hypothetical protein